jgi:hypothetical protein
MTSQQRPLGLSGTTGGLLTEQKVGFALASVAFGLSVACTSLAMQNILNSNWLLGVFASLVVQAFLTWLESPIWRFKPSFLAAICLVADTLINGAGIAPYMGKINDIEAYKYLQKLLGFTHTITEQQGLWIALVLGCVLASLPEAIMYTSFGKRGNND